MKNAVLIISIPIIFFSDLLFAAIILIPADYPTIQEGINAANEGDTVLVSPGTYAENIIWPVVNGIKLIGEDRNTTIIDGNQSGSVIYFHDSTIDTSTLVSNFTIKNGSSSKGGGIYCITNSSPRGLPFVSTNSTPLDPSASKRKIFPPS